MKIKKNNAIQHGEVWLSEIPESDLPEDGIVTKHNSFIIGHSESGHNHVLESKTKFDVIRSANEVFIRLKSRAKVVHQKTHDKHRDTPVKKKSYRVRIKREFNPIAEVWRKVQD